MGFEPTRAEHIGLAVQRLNHSATSSPGIQKLHNSYNLLVTVTAYKGSAFTISFKGLMRRLTEPHYFLKKFPATKDNFFLI